MTENTPINMSDLEIVRGTDDAYFLKSNKVAPNNPDGIAPYSGPLESTPTHKGFMREGKFTGEIGIHTGLKWHNFHSGFPTLKDKGQITIIQNYKDGIKHGTRTEYLDESQNQKTAQSSYKDGRQDGLDTEWHQNGHKSKETNWVDGTKSGVSTEWHENGKKLAEITFVAGSDYPNKSGLERYWNSKGELELEINHDLLTTEPDSTNPINITPAGLKRIAYFEDRAIISISLLTRHEVNGSIVETRSSPAFLWKAARALKDLANEKLPEFLTSNISSATKSGYLEALLKNNKADIIKIPNSHDATNFNAEMKNRNIRA